VTPGPSSARRPPAIPLALTSVLLFFGLGWAGHEGGPWLVLLLVPALGLGASIVVAIRGVRGSLFLWTILCLLGAVIMTSMIFVAGVTGGSLPH
jgi:hypothetical protein